MVQMENYHLIAVHSEYDSKGNILLTLAVGYD